ncbi:hypothetical protein AMTRI_Chr02g223210 [Amborella trichopoda]
MAPQTEDLERWPPVEEVWDELKRIGFIALPSTATALTGHARGLISALCLGLLGPINLAGGSLALAFINVTSQSLLSGLALGMEPLCTQAAGSNNFLLLYTTLLRTMALLAIFALVIAPLWLAMKPLALALGQDSEVATVAAVYCKAALPTLAAACLGLPMRVYMRCRGWVGAMVWCGAVGVVVHLLLAWILVFRVGMELKGVAVAGWLAAAGVAGWRTVSVERGKSSRVAGLRGGEEGGWKELMRMAVPSCVGVCLEWWWYELMTLLAGYLYNPKVTLAAAGIIIQTTSLMYTIPVGLSAAASTRVGNALGGDRPDRARIATWVAMSLAVIASLLCLTWTILARKQWAGLFTNDEEVLELVMGALPVIGLCEIGNCPQTTACGVLRGSARPAIGATINLYSFYLVGTPIGIALAFGFDMGFVGLCYGLLCAQLVCSMSIVLVVLRTDWDKEALKAKHIVGIDSHESNLEVVEACLKMNRQIKV